MEKYNEINALVEEKIDELNKYVERLKKENAKVNELKGEYERLRKKLNYEKEEFNKKKDDVRAEFERKKEEELKKIEKEKKILLKNTNLLQNFPSKKVRDEIDGLKEQILKLQEEIKAKEQRNTLTLTRLKKQLNDAMTQNETLKQEIKVYETAL